MYAPASAKNYGAIRRFTQPMPLAVGQYIVHGTTDDDGERSVSRTSIVGRDSGGWVYEFHSITGSEETLSQICIRGIEKARTSGNADDIEILWVKTKGEDGQVQKIEGPMLYMVRAMYKGAISNLNTKIDIQTSGGPVTVPAGTFAGTISAKAEVSILGRTFKSSAWYHSAVPINGLVKSVTDNNSNTIELLDFGARGATSQLRE